MATPRIPATACLMSALVAAATLGFAAEAGAQDERGPQGYSMDTQLVRPNFSVDGLLGTDSPRVLESGAIRWGTLLQYENSPVRLIEFDEPQGAIVSHRITMHLGLAFSPTKRVSTRVVLPVIAQFGSQIDALAADGPGLGDLSGGMRWYAGTWDRVSVGFYGDLFLPIGTRNSFMGETRPRVAFGSNMAFDFSENNFTLFTNLGVILRSATVAEQDLTLSNELALNVGGRYSVVPKKLAVTGEILTRLGFARFLTGGGENSMEWLAGLQISPKDSLRFDLALGRGITQGYGTSGVRVAAGVSFVKVPKPPEPEVERFVDLTELPDEEPEVEIPVVVVPKPTPPEEKAWVRDNKIEIRDPIQFELATSKILPQSLPTLAAVAKVLEFNPLIGHLVIEGHASEEGTYEYNYDLAKRRADAIWEQLLKNGVHPSRMSTRSMGEVVPKQQGTEEEQLAVNRRVEFHIVKQFRGDEELPDYATQVLRPWDGGAQPITNPPKPERPAAVVTPPKPRAVDGVDDLEVEGGMTGEIPLPPTTPVTPATPVRPVAPVVEGGVVPTTPTPPVTAPKAPVTPVKPAEPADDRPTWGVWTPETDTPSSPPDTPEPAEGSDDEGQQREEAP